MLETIEAIFDGETFRPMRMPKLEPNTRVRFIMENIKTNTVQSDGYAALDRLMGICNTGETDASLNHDIILYKRKTSP